MRTAASEMGDKAAVKSADRVFDLFELLAPRSEGLSHTAIADALEIPKSSLTQLMKTAVARGFIRYGQEDKKYRLGDRFTALAGRTSVSHDLIAQSQPILEEITATTRESSALNFLRGEEAEVVATVSSPQRLVSHMRLGDAAPLYATSGGKIILAYRSDEEIEAYTARVVFTSTTPNTVSSTSELRQHLDRIRKTGVAYSMEEYTPGIIGIATAVLDGAGRSLASINVALPAVRYGEELEATVVSSLRKASARLGARARL